jgi:hypothetical protein
MDTSVQAEIQHVRFRQIDQREEIWSAISCYKYV